MRVLFVYQFLTLGGVETVLRARLDSLPDYGVAAEAWFLSDAGGAAVFAGLEEQVHVGPLDMVRAYLATDPFDVVATIDTPEAFAVVRGGTAAHVVECHTPYVENQTYLKAVDEQVASAVFVPTRHQAAVVRQKLRRPLPVEVVPNPLQAGFVAEPRDDVPAPVRPVVAWVGRLDDLKNWRGFLDLAHHVVEQGTDAEFWLVGRPVQPELIDRLQKQAKRLGVLGRLRWYSGLAPAHLPRLLDLVRASGGVVVSTSKGESFGMTVAEAMARRCAVAVPDRSPFDEFVDDGTTGLLYRDGSMVDAARAVVRLVGDAALSRRLGAAARQSVVAQFAPGPASETLAKALHDVVERSAR